MIVRIERFGVNALRRQGAAAGRCDRKIAAPKSGRDFEPRGRRQRWHQVDVLHRIAHASPGRLRVWQPHDPRHADYFVIEEQPVLFLDVVAQALAVIREHDDRRRVAPAACLQRAEQVADDLVGKRDLAVVGGKIREAFRRAIRRVARRGEGKERTGPT